MGNTIKLTGKQLVHIEERYMDEAQGEGYPIMRGRAWFDQWCASMGYDRNEVEKLQQEYLTAHNG